jgi:hypothetical protein
MNTKHTAGNWEICAETETQIFIASTKAGARSEQGKGSYICQIKQEREHFGINEQDRANAQLICAAPELLEALETLLKSYAADFEQITGAPLNQTEAVKQAQAAIRGVKCQD